MRSNRNADRRLPRHVPDWPQVTCHDAHVAPVIALHGAGREALLPHAERQRHLCDRPVDDNPMALAERSIASSGDDKHRCQRRPLVPHRTDSHQADQTHGIDTHLLSLAEDAAA